VWLTNYTYNNMEEEETPNQPREKQFWWRLSNDEQQKWGVNNNNDIVETTVNLRLSRNFYIATHIISNSLGYNSFEEYVNEMVRENIRMEMDGAGSLEQEEIEQVEKKMLFIDRQIDR
jgi:hypothetical protein